MTQFSYARTRPPLEGEIRGGWRGSADPLRGRMDRSNRAIRNGIPWGGPPPAPAGSERRHVPGRQPCPTSPGPGLRRTAAVTIRVGCFPPPRTGGDEAASCGVPGAGEGVSSESRCKHSHQGRGHRRPCLAGGALFPAGGAVWGEEQVLVEGGPSCPDPRRTC